MYIIQNEIGSASIDVNFHLLKSLEIFDKNSADKIWSKKEKGMEIALPQANTGSWVKIEHFHSIVKETRNRTEIQCTNSYFLCWNVHFISAGYENGIL